MNMKNATAEIIREYGQFLGTDHVHGVTYDGQHVWFAEILRTIESNRFVTGITWVDGELWHGTWEGDESDVRRIDPRTGEVLEKIDMPPGVGVSGLESDGGDLFFCGGGRSGKVRTVRSPKRDSTVGNKPKTSGKDSKSK